MTEPEQSRIAALEAEAADLKRRNAVLLEKLAKAHDDLGHVHHRKGAEADWRMADAPWHSARRQLAAGG